MNSGSKIMPRIAIDNSYNSDKKSEEGYIYPINPNSYKD